MKFTPAIPGRFVIALLLSSAFAAPTAAQPLPGPADAARVHPPQEMMPKASADTRFALPETATPAVAAPPGAEKIHLVLKDVTFNDVAAVRDEYLYRHDPDQSRHPRA